MSNGKLSQYTAVLLGLIMNFAISCSTTDGKQSNLENQVLHHYKNDELKLRAAKFLFSNMQSNLHVENGRIVPDLASMTPKMIIDNIDLAFAASNHLLNSHIITFDDFLEYVLPYRINYSKYDDFRSEVMKKNRNLSVTNIKTENELIHKINDLNKDILPGFTFDLSFSQEDTLSFADIKKIKRGSCLSMAQLGQFYFRGLGIPVALDYVICWGNMNGGHTWNSLILPNKKHLPFLGIEQQIGDYDPTVYIGIDKGIHAHSTFKKAGKVYRKTFSIQKNSIAYRYRMGDKIPPTLRDYKILDVTGNYYKVKSLSTDTMFNGVESEMLVLHNFSSQQWIPIAVTDLEKGTYKFSNLARDMLYSFRTFEKKKYKNVYFPFYINDDGIITTFKPQKKKADIRIKYIKSLESDQAYFGSSYIYELADAIFHNLRRRASNEKTYTLFLWNKAWIKIATTVPDVNNELLFKNVPKNGLYMVTDGQRSIDDRPFMIKNFKVKWL